MYRVSSLNEKELSIAELLAEAVELIPEGMQFPELAMAVIRFQNKEYRCHDYTPSEWQLTVENHRMSGKVFSISVHYREKPASQPVFLPEEFQLLNAVGDMLTLKIERRLHDLELNASRDKYQSLIQSIDGIIWEAKASTFEFTYVSPQVERLLGYTAEEWLGEPGFWANRIHPDDREQALFYCTEKTKAAEDHHFEYRMSNKAGEWRWIRDIVTVICENGIPVFLRGVMMDITEIKNAEDSIEFERQNKEAIINSTQDLIWSVTLDKKLITANNAFLSSLLMMTGRTFHAGDSLMSIYDFPKDYWELWDSLYNRVLAGESFRYEMSTPTPVNGLVYWFQTSFNPIMEGDKVIGAACYSRDISDNKEYIRRLEENNARFREIAWMQSHTVRPPLARIKGLNSLLQAISPGEDKDTYRQLLDFMAVSTNELDDILQQIVDRTSQLEE